MKLQACVAVPPSVACSSLAFRASRVLLLLCLESIMVWENKHDLFAESVLKVVLLKSGPEYVRTRNKLSPDVLFHCSLQN